MTAKDLQQIRQVLREELSFQLPIQLEKILPVQLERILPEQLEKILPVQLERILPEQLEKTLPGKIEKVIHIQLAKFTEEVLLPAIESLIQKEVRELKKQISPARYADKYYVDDKVGDLRGDVLAGRKKDSARVDAHIKMHHRKGHLTDKEVEQLDKMRGFAPLPIKI